MRLSKGCLSGLAFGTTMLLAVAALAGAPAQTDAEIAQEAIAAVPRYPHAHTCNQAVAPHHARCHALARVTDQGEIVAFAAPPGLGAADLQSAYNVTSGTPSGATVAIVDAQDDPNAEADLAVYRSTFGLPACTTANGCFKKVNQSGQQSSYPAPDEGWATEISLDLDMVSAICPDCKILLVEANSSSMDDLGIAVNQAVSLGAAAVSNSYGGSEDNSIAASDSYFNHPGVFITVSSGDDGYGVEYPASSPYVTAVGGTSLTRASTSRGWAEATWNGAGSGCSAWEGKPSFQTDSSCGTRTVVDVSAIADPNTGVAVYDTYGSQGHGWMQFGGTSASAPIIASVFVRAGSKAIGAGNDFSYRFSSDLYDVISGSNSSSGCSPAYWCTAGAGYDGPTGNGTPNEAAIAATFASGQGGQGSVTIGPPGNGSGGSGGGTGGGGGGGGSCPPGAIDIGGICIPLGGCSTTSGGSWVAALGLGIVALAFSRRRRS